MSKGSLKMRCRVKQHMKVLNTDGFIKLRPCPGIIAASVDNSVISRVR